MARDATHVRKYIGTKIGEYVLEELVGWGAFSKVYRARHTLRGTEVAVKMINKSKDQMGSISNHISECEILKLLKHPNIIELVEYFETDRKWYVITKLAKNGDLLDFVNNNGLPPIDRVKTWFAQLVDALDYVHSCGYAHKDIKLDNIFIDGENVILGDWGFACTYEKGLMSEKWAGTDGYLAPEIVQRQPFEGPELDSWALGVVLYVLIVGKLPFNKASPNYHNSVISGEYDLPDNVDSAAKILITGLMNPLREGRMTMEEVKLHPFYQTAARPDVKIKLEDSASARESPSYIKRKPPAQPKFTTVLIHQVSSRALASGIPREPKEPPQSASGSRAGSRAPSQRNSNQGSAVLEKQEIAEVPTEEILKDVTGPLVASALEASSTSQQRESLGSSGPLTQSRSDTKVSESIREKEHKSSSPTSQRRHSLKEPREKTRSRSGSRDSKEKEKEKKRIERRTERKKKIKQSQ